MSTKSSPRSDSQPRARKLRQSLRPRATDYDVYIGARLRLARKLAGLTLNELADALGVSFQAVQKYESGENRMAAPRLFKAAQVLGTNIRFFARPSGEDTADPENASSFASDELELLRHYRQVTDGETRLALRKLVQAMAEADTASAPVSGKISADETQGS
jgi:transcriptional regulator with XRE-family HTH domain